MTDELNHSDHQHFICTGCQMGFCTAAEQYKDMKEGDGCPECHIATVTEIKLIGPIPPGFEMVQEMLRGFTEQIAQRDEKALEIRRQTRDALRSIATSLELLVQCIATDDLGRPAIRLTGEIVGGDGDVTAET